jgi:hypothetical protein
VGLHRGGERQHAGHARAQDACRGESGQPSAVGADPDVAYADPAQGKGRGPGGEGDELAATADGIERVQPEQRGVEDGVDPTRDQGAHAIGEVRPARDEPICPEVPDGGFAGLGRDGDDVQFPGVREGDGIPADRPRRTGDQQGSVGSGEIEGLAAVRR